MSATAEAEPAIERASFFRNTSALMGSQAATFVLALALAVMLPRFLGASGLGDIRIAIALWAVADVVIAFGTSTTVTLALARDSHAGDVVGKAIVARLVLYTLSFVVVLGFALAAGYSTKLLLLIILQGTTSFCLVFYGPASSAFYGLERMGSAAIADVACKVFVVSASVVVLMLGGREAPLVVIGTLGAALSAVIVITRLRKVPGIRFRGQVRHVVPMLKSSFPFFLNDASLVLYLQLDAVVLSFLATSRDVGWYGGAATIYGVLIFAPVILMTTLFPILARIHESEPERLQAHVQRAFSALMLLAFPLGLGTAVLASQAAVLLYGSDFGGTGPVLAVMGVQLMLAYPIILLGRVAIATGQQRFWAMLMLVVVLVSLPLDVALVSWSVGAFDNGAIGAAIDFVITDVLIFVVATWKLAPYLLSGGARVRMAKCAVAAAAMVACIWPLRNTFILVPVVVGAVAYGAVVWLLRTLTREEVAMLRAGLARIGSVVGTKRRSLA